MNKPNFPINAEAIMKTIKIIGCIFLIGTAISCGKTKDQAEFSKTKDDNIIVDGIILKKIKIETIAEEDHFSKLTTFGNAQAITNKFAKVAAPFSGRITKSFIRLGQRVNTNAPVFEISAPSFSEAGKIYYQTKQELAQAERNLLRQRDLLKNGVGVQKECEEAEVLHENCKRDYENSMASLKVFNVDPETLVLGQPLIVRAPIRGEIVENNLVIGQYIKEDAEPLVTIAELSKIWIVGQVKEKDINLINEHNHVQVSLASAPGKMIDGQIFHISEMLDEETRSVKVFIECANANRTIKPGMYVRIQFENVPQKVIAIPSTSVFQDEDKSFVFIKTGKNQFKKQPIEIAETDELKIILKSGLKPSDEIVTAGGMFLLEKGSAL
jgi:cobalt-zinc-cadmium efflux system membrane fusion protein